jgi:hypothetical protein
MANGLIDFGITRPNAAMETYQQGQQNQLAQMQLAQAQQAIRDAEAEREAWKGASDYGQVQQRLMGQGLGKQALAVSAAQAKQQADKIALQKDKLTLMKSYASRAMVDPANAESLLMEYAKQTGSDVTAELERLRANGGDLEKNRMWAASLAVDADKLLPKFQHLDTGGAIQMGTVNPVTGAFIPGQAVRKTMTPGEAGGAYKSTISVNTQLPASEEAQREFMKETRQTYSSLKQAPVALQNIEKAKALIPGAKGFMGQGGEPLLATASFLNNRLGTNIDTKGVTDAQELRSRLFMGILDNLKKLDSQPSAQQQAALQEALGSIGTDPKALPRVLDAFGESIRTKVDLHNQEVTSAEGRGVKFPYDAKIKLPEAAKPTASKPSAVMTPAPAGVDAALWNVMTPEERKLWVK